MATYCICCGKKGVRWPKLRPMVCSMKCPAKYWLYHCDQPNNCPKCGAPTRGDECPDHPEEDDEGGGA